MPPIHYLAATKADAERQLPRAVIAQGIELTCGRCAVAVLAVRATWDRIVNLSKRTGVEISVSCPSCFPQAAEGDHELTLYHVDRELENAVRRCDAERN